MQGARVVQNKHRSSRRPAIVFGLSSIVLLLAACTSADPALVSQSVSATLTAVPTNTPIVVVVTVVNAGTLIPTVTKPPETETPAPPPTDALAGTITVEASATPLPAPAASLTPPGPLLFADDFSQVSVWNVGEDAVQRTAISDGQLTFTIKEPDQFRFLFNLTRRARDFYAALVGSTQACQFRDRYGLLFRVQDNANYYQFEVDCDGRYRLSHAAQGVLTSLKDWTPSTAIRSGGGAVNELGVRAQGKTLEVFVNGQTLFETADDAYAEGGFGLYAGAGLSQEFTASFDSFSVWEIR